MSHRVEKYLWDIRRACELLEGFTQDRSFEEFEADALFRSGVERQLMIIGEALFQAVKRDHTLLRRLTHARRWVNFRHVVVHGYTNLMAATVWGLMESALPMLHHQVAVILEPDAPASQNRMDPAQLPTPSAALFEGEPPHPTPRGGDRRR